MSTATLDFVKTVNGIIRLEMGPEDLPRSWLLLALTLAAYGLSEVGLNLFTHTLPGAGVGAAAALALLILFTAGLLGVYWLGGRILQTLTALALTGTMASVAGMALRAVLFYGLPPEAPFQKIAAFVFLPVALWRAVMFAFIFWRAAPVPVAVAYILGFLYVLGLGALVTYGIPRSW